MSRYLIEFPLKVWVDVDLEELAEGEAPPSTDEILKDTQECVNAALEATYRQEGFDWKYACSSMHDWKYGAGQIQEV